MIKGAYTEASGNGLWSMDRWQIYSLTWRERDGRQTAEYKEKDKVVREKMLWSSPAIYPFEDMEKSSTQCQLHFRGYYCKW